MSVSPIVFSPFVKAVKEFQELGLVNKALLDATAVDIPLVGLAKNPTERKERFVRQALVLLICFVIAPLHARLVSKLMSHHFKISEKAMRIPFDALKNQKALIQSLKAIAEKTMRPSERLRKSIVSAKTGFMMVDLAVCGFLLSSVGSIKVLFGKLITGKSQFTGEQGIVSEKALNQIYQQETKASQVKNYNKEIATLSLGVGVPLLTGLLLRKAFMKPVLSSTKPVLHCLAALLDYNYPKYTRWLKGWPMVSDGALIMLAGLLTLGELTSARSPREFKELAIQRNSIDALFFFGAPMFMKMLSGATTVQGAINLAKGKSAKVLKLAATGAAKSYVASYLLAGLAVAGIVVVTNNMTRQAVKNKAEAIGLS